MGTSTTEMRDVSKPSDPHSTTMLSGSSMADADVLHAAALRYKDVLAKSAVLQGWVDQGKKPLAILTWMDTYSAELLYSLHRVNPRLTKVCTDLLSSLDDTTRQEWLTHLSPDFKRFLASVDAKKEALPASYRAPSFSATAG